MNGLSGVELGGVIAISFGLIEIIKALINKRFSNNKNGVSGLTDEQKQQLKTLHDLHYRFDDNGVPLWYVPRSWGELLKEIAKLLEKVSHIQKTIIKTQERQTCFLDKIFEKLPKTKE